MNFRDYGMNTANDVVREIANDIRVSTEKVILEQLNDFISRGLIVIESTQPILVQDPTSASLKIVQHVKLTLKDKEYIVKLEEENKRLNQLVSNLEEYFKK